MKKMDSAGRFAILRKRVIDAKVRMMPQWFWHCADRYLAVKGHEDLPGDIRVAMMAENRLKSVKFDLAEEELLIGRALPPEPVSPELQAEAEAYFSENPWGNNVGQTGHCQPDYPEIFSLGVSGLRRKIQTHGNGTFHQTCLMVLDGFAAMIRHAAETARKAGADEIAGSCERIADEPPRTFRDAVQLMWFIILGIELADRANLVVPGRLDKLLISFYLNDLSEKRITHDEARDLLAQLYLFLNDHAQNGLAYSVMVGGDTVNEVSYLALEALRYSLLSYPSVGICVNGATPHDLKRLAVDIIADGLPTPAFFNDSVIRRGVQHYGVPASNAGYYINSTCVEITPCGASNVYVASPYFNLCGILLETMENDASATWDEFMRKYCGNLDAKIRDAAAEQNNIRRARADRMRRPLQSIFTRDCIERGKDIECGGARYNWVECSFVGLANLVDSLYVIRQEVFEKKNFTMTDLKKLCDTGFENQENVRLRFLNGYPKYGLADRNVDSMIPPLLEHIRQECAKYKMEPDGSPFIPGTFCWIMHQILGTATQATPDGRSAKFPFADGAGPAQGREKLGPTAAVCSVTSWDHSRLIGGTAFNMKYTKALLASDENREKLISLIDVFIQNGGFETQINVADYELLKKAQKNPEEYSDLIVRIGGYTDYFVKLSPEMQQEVLLRTQYSSI